MLVKLILKEKYNVKQLQVKTSTPVSSFEKCKQWFKIVLMWLKWLERKDLSNIYIKVESNSNYFSTRTWLQNLTHARKAIY